MATNKVEYFGEVLIDLTTDTVSPLTLLNGIKAHDRSGAVITGMYKDTPKRANENLILESYNRGTATSYGVTRTYIGNCTYRISGTSTGNVDMVLYMGRTVPSGTYTMSIVGDTSLLTDCYVTVNGTSSTVYSDKVTKNILTFSVPSGGTIRYIGIHIPTGVTINTDLQFKLESGSESTDWIPNPADSGGGGGLPTGISALDFGEITVSSAFTTTRQTFNHNLGVIPDLMIVYSPSNVATTYSMLAAIRGDGFGWRASNYNSHYAYHGNSTTTVTWTNSNSTTYGISNMTASTFQLASHSTSYYWRAGTYKYIAIKFS